MAFKTVLELDADVTISLGGVNKKSGKKNPSQVEGYYLGSKTVASKKAKSGECSIYILQTAQGNVGVWGKTNLDQKMRSAPVGAMLRLTHTGFQSTPNGEMYKYSVEVDADNSIEVPDVAPQKQTASTSTFNTTTRAVGNVDDDDETESYSSSQADEDEERQNQALLAAERKAKVQALLAGKGKR